MKKGLGIASLVVGVLGIGFGAYSLLKKDKDYSCDVLSDNMFDDCDDEDYNEDFDMPETKNPTL